ncbi:hypothetical protein NLG97_g1483 [Lecanicillium saksenae]|uniref:Uncharacterized protein n=1 Tax=Lecanicillium saksenae TaxID=468837 RepID=A0ACC1R515_9HYPO|nr:hypothetical protein NLG97_g1483 [Lecanicillium saksenae]
MQIFQTLFAVAAFASAATAAPLEERTPDWIIQGMSRTCDKKDTSCTWKFAINNQETTPTHCTYVVKAANGQPASRSNGGPVTCGDYTITSGWSGQFVVGFTTFAMYDNKRKLIAYPAYDDNEINSGKVPDKPFHAAPPKA